MEILWNNEIKSARTAELIDDETHKWLELALFAMQSRVSKEQFREFLEDEAQKRGKIIKNSC